MKGKFILINIILIVCCIVLSSYIVLSYLSTSVTIELIDETGTLPVEKHILSIYDPTNNNDFRFAQFSTKNRVTFNNVPQDRYMAHAYEIKEFSDNHTLVDVKRGDKMKITFFYGAGSRWRYTIETTGRPLNIF